MDIFKNKDNLTTFDTSLFVNLDPMVNSVSNLKTCVEIEPSFLYGNGNLNGTINRRNISTRFTEYYIDPFKPITEDIASKNLITISQEKPIRESLMIMYKHKIRWIHVIEPDSKELVGIINTHDLIAAYNSLELPLKSLKSNY